MANKKDKKKRGHECPKIPSDWSLKMTPPAWNGENVDKARRMWYDWLRSLEMHAKPMPRRTSN